MRDVFAGGLLPAPATHLTPTLSRNVVALL